MCSQHVVDMKILRTGTLVGVGMAGLGLVCGVLYSVGGFFVDLFTIGLNWGTVLAFGALVGMPVVFGVFGFLAGALIALVVGGVGRVLDRMRR